MYIQSNRQPFELVVHQTFDVTTTQALTESYLTAVKHSLSQTLSGTWIELKPLDNTTINVCIETTDPATHVLETITTLIQKGTMST